MDCIVGSRIAWPAECDPISAEQGNKKKNKKSIWTSSKETCKWHINIWKMGWLVIREPRMRSTTRRKEGLLYVGRGWRGLRGRLPPSKTLRSRTTSTPNSADSEAVDTLFLCWQKWRMLWPRWKTGQQCLQG